MLNTHDFIKRLEIVLEFYCLSASVFADKIGVQRSSLSHLLSGRNKPSLDFVLKIIEVFPEVDLYWILIGKGAFPNTKEENNINKSRIADEKPEKLHEQQSDLPKSKVAPNEFEAKKTLVNEDNSFTPTQSQIEKIVIFYKNGTFKDYNSEPKSF
jgi:transcriptional regulator with XRE-family HTH domain